MTSTRRPTRRGQASSRCGQSAGRAARDTRTTKRRSVSGIGSGSARIRSCSSARRSATTARVRAVHARVDALAPPVELVLEVQGVGEAPAGLEVAVQEAVAALERSLWLGASPASRITQPSESSPQKARKSSVGVPARGRSRPRGPRPASPAGRPSRYRQRLIPQAMSGNSLEKTSAPANGARIAAARRSRHSPGVSGHSRPGSLQRGSTQVELRHLAGAVAGALDSCAAAAGSAGAARAADCRGSSLTPLIALLLDLLADAHAGEPGLVRKQLLDARH